MPAHLLIRRRHRSRPPLWLPPPQGGKQLNPDGMAEFAGPARVLFVQAARTEDQLWAMEEALRSGAGGGGTG